MCQKNQINQNRQDCWDEAVNCFGTGYIFEKRARQYRLKIKILQFLGIAVPASVGVLVVSFGKEFKYLNWVLVVASIVALFQFVISIWALVSNWQETYTYSLNSSAENNKLSNRFSGLAKNPPQDFQEFNLTFNILKTENEYRKKDDNKQGIIDKEKRMGMCAGLRQFRRECSTCHKVPESMEPSGCDTCGNF